MGDLQLDSLHRLHRLSEFRIELTNVLPDSFDVYHAPTWQNQEQYNQLCWSHLPEEDNTFADIDGLTFGFNEVRPVSKRESFIVNSDKIEKDYGLLLADLTAIYGEAFYQLRDKANKIKLLSIDEVSTCLLYWK